MIPGLTEENSSDVVFAYSSNPLLAANMILLIVFIPVLIGYVQSANIIAILPYLILDTLLVGSASRLYMNRIHRASFFTDHFEVRGRNLKRNIDYRWVASVERVRVAPVFANPTQVRINLIAEDSLLVPGNLRSKKLNTNLYDWLSKKVEINRPDDF